MGIKRGRLRLIAWIVVCASVVVACASAVTPTPSPSAIASRQTPAPENATALPSTAQPSLAPTAVPTASPTPRPPSATVLIQVISCGSSGVDGTVAGGRKLGHAKVLRSLLGTLDPAALAVYVGTPYPGERPTLVGALLGPRGWKCQDSGGMDYVGTALSPPNGGAGGSIRVGGGPGSFEMNPDALDACRHDPGFRTAFLKAVPEGYPSADVAACRAAHPDGIRIASELAPAYAYNTITGSRTTYQAMSWNAASWTSYSCTAPTKGLCEVARRLYFVPSKFKLTSP